LASIYKRLFKFSLLKLDILLKNGHSVFMFEEDDLVKNLVPAVSECC